MRPWFRRFLLTNLIMVIAVIVMFQTILILRDEGRLVGGIALLVQLMVIWTITQLVSRPVNRVEYRRLRRN